MLAQPSTRRTVGSRRFRRAVVTLLLGAAVVVVAAGPAGAHADFLQSSPAAGQVLQTPPKEIVLNFTEPVEVQPGSIRVFNTDEERLDSGSVEASGSTVRMALPKLDDGSYVVTWRATSTDAHPIEGAFTFQVGAAGNATSREVTNLADQLLAETKGDRAVGAAYGAVRWFVFAAMALLLGAVAFCIAVLPSARSSRRTRRVVWGSWIALAVATVVGILLYGPYVAGLGFGDAFQWSVIETTLGQRFGQVWAVRLGLLLVAAPVLFVLLRRDSEGDAREVPAWWPPVALPLGVAIAATPGLAGHASSGDWRTAAIISDTLHVLAMSAWLGGLVMLAVVLLPGRHANELREVLPRWSKIAFGCVALIIATGSFQTWRQVGGLEALRTTDFGRILVVKIVLFSVLLVLAAFSREIVLRLYPLPKAASGRVPVVAGGSDDDGDWDPDETGDLRRLRVSVLAEFGVAVALLVATALLVNAPPAKSDVAQGLGTPAVGTTLDGDQVSVDITLTPGDKGRNDVHVSTLGPKGALKSVQELTITFSNAERGVKSLDVPLRDLSPGHYLSPGFDLPFDGDWQIAAKVLLSEFDQETLTGTVEVE
jgi:copper transport protein